MTQRTCAACDEPVRDSYVICRGCTHRTRNKLSDQENLRQELLTALARDTQMTAPNDGGKSAEHPLPIDPRAAEMLHAQKALLVSWCRLLHDEQGAPYPADTVAAMACHIEAWLDRLALHEAAGELVAEVRDLERLIMKVIDYPDVRSRITVGPCVNQLEDGTQCPGEMSAHFPRDESKRPFISCGFCRHEWAPEQWTGVERLIKRKAVA